MNDTEKQPSHDISASILPQLDSFELTPVQRGMLSDALMGGSSRTNILQVAISLPEVIQESSLKDAWRQSCSEFDALRFAYSNLDGTKTPRQHPLTPNTGDFPWNYLDWSTHGEARNEREWMRFLEHDRQLGVCPKQAPPAFRLTLVKLRHNEYRLLWTLHHIILDGRSVFLVLKETFLTYEALKNQESITSVKRPQFQEYLNWYANQDFDRSKDFWRQHLMPQQPSHLRSAMSPSAALHAGSKKEHFKRTIERELASKIQKRANETGVTPNTIFQGTLAFLLSNYQSKDDVYFSEVRACRRCSFPNADSVAGILMNCVPRRINVDASKTIREWLGKLRSESMELRHHEMTPLSTIASTLEGTEFQDSQNCLYVYESHSLSEKFQDLGVAFKSRRIELHQQSSFPLVFAIRDGSTVSIELERSENTFQDVPLAAIADHYCQILENFVASPHQKCGDLAIRSHINGWDISTINSVESLATQDYSAVCHRIDSSCDLWPQKTAIRYHRETLTYQQLKEKSGSIASALNELGIGPEDIVAVRLNASIDYILVLLGIWKSGATILPIDTECPKERLIYLLEDTKARFLIGNEPERPTEINKTLNLSVQSLVHDGARKLNNSARRIHPHQAAYVIYTSGSTGKPKGVVVSHQALDNHCRAITRRFELQAEDVALQFTSVGFDVSLEEIVPTLAAGATLVLRHEKHTSIASFLQLVQQHGVSILNIPTAYWQTIIGDQDLKKNGFSQALRLLIIGGEAFSPELLKGWLEIAQNSDTKLINAYGPTESTITATLSRLEDQSDPLDWDNVIGTTLDNITAFILDHHLRPAPIGIPGELYLGGLGIARGYLNRSDLTADRFIPNPYSNQGGGRLYRTGDIAVMRECGEIRFLGRQDEQVKIRGFRIELDEIRSVLDSHPDVMASALSVKQRANAGAIIYAFVTVNDGSKATSCEIDSFLAEKLPAYMIPNQIVLVEDLPINRSGKIDFECLYEAMGDRPSPTETSNFSQSERALANIWEEVLDVAVTGVNENFFCLGGDSLTATRMLSRINQTTGITIPYTKVFENPRLRDLARSIEVYNENFDNTEFYLGDLDANERDEFVI